MTERVAVAGIGMVPFATPSKADSYDVLAEQAVRAALADAGLDLSAVQQAYAGYVYGDSTSGQNALYRVGMTGIPVINVNNNCSTGSSALYLARQAVASGAADCVLALGFEQMQRGALKAHWDDRPSAFTRFDEAFTREQFARDRVTWATSRRRPGTSVRPGRRTATSTGWTLRCSRRSR